MQDKAYDVILCDYNLGPGKKDGQQVLEEAKYREFIRYSTIFIMLTAENTMAMVMGAFEYQPDDYLIKPINNAVLFSRIETIMKRKADFEDIEEAISNKEYMHAISLCGKHAKNNPKNILEYMRLKSNLCLTIGRYDEATAVYEKVLSMRELPWAKMGMGKVYFLTKSYVQAKEVFQSIIEDNKTFMEAYDWLAKTLKEMESMEEAQKVLLAASELSPKAILRHQAIGEISYEIKDYDIAEEAFKSAIEIGHNSCFKGPSEYTGLAKTFLKKDSSEEALSILSNAREEFKGNNSAILQTAITEGVAYKELARDEEAEKAVDEAAKLLDSLSSKIPVEATMDLAKVCFKLGKKEKGVEFMQNVVRNYHDNEKIIQKVQDVFDEAELQEEGKIIISSTKSEIVELNNKGVGLVQEGKLEEAIEYFKKAASGLPESKIINTNAAQAIIMHMKEKGANDQHMYQALQYLDRVKKIDPSYKQYQSLLNLYEKLASSSPVPDK
jgi:tetratricopeptide (TPR) repeat protein